MFGVKDSYQPGDPLASIRMRDLSLMAAFLNYLSVGKYFRFTKPDEPSQDTPPCLALNIEELAADLPGKDYLTHYDITDWDAATAEFAKQEDVDELTDSVLELTEAVQGIVDVVDGILADYATESELDALAADVADIVDVVDGILADYATESELDALAADLLDLAADVVDVAQEVTAINEDLDDLVSWYNTGVRNATIKVCTGVSWNGTKLVYIYRNINVVNGLITSVPGSDASTDVDTPTVINWT